MSPPRRLTRGTYVGDVTALCALTPPSDGVDAADSTRLGAHDTLLAGIGASVRWYDPFRAGGDVSLLSTDVFPSARVHGILPVPVLDAFVGSASPSGGRAILVWGERRVAVVSLLVGDAVPAADRRLTVVRIFPPLGHWVHDARCVLPDGNDDTTTVVLGLADNAVEQWSLGTDVSPPSMLRRVECAKRSMLYSLALHGDTMGTLRVAGGTIFNEVQLWMPGEAVGNGGIDAMNDSDENQTRPNPFAILAGHEGSIMRVAWSEDGARVLSTSDDRTARGWDVTQVSKIEKPYDDITIVTSAPFVAYGHGGRVWDCQKLIAGKRKLLVTACEDCAVRLWDDTGGGDFDELNAQRDPIAVLRGHRGRGIWRAISIRNPFGSTSLATAGADASIKLWDLSEYARGNEGDDPESTSADPNNSLETFAGPALPVEDNKTVEKPLLRAISLVQPGVVFVGTDRGAVHEGRAPFSFHETDENRLIAHTDTQNSKHEWRWRRNVWQAPNGPSKECAVVSIASLRSDTTSGDTGDIRLAVADALGCVTIISIPNDHCDTATTLWQSKVSPPRRLLDVLVGEHGDIFTIAVGGIVKLFAQSGTETTKWRLDGVCESPFRQRALCASRTKNSELVVIGDQVGNVCVFDTEQVSDGADKAPLGHGASDDVTDKKTFPLLAAERHAHGQHSVSLVEVRVPGQSGVERFHGAEVITGGRDGRLCTRTLRVAQPVTEEDTQRGERRIQFEKKALDECELLLKSAEDKNRKKLARAVAAAANRVATAEAAVVAANAPYSLECVSNRSIPGMSSVDATRWDTNNGDENNSNTPSIVAGFRETDFVIRDLTNQVELLRVSCGGWHRPFSLWMDTAITKTFAFAFFKNGQITTVARRSAVSKQSDQTDDRIVNAAAWHARALNVWLHGREVHTVAVVPPPTNAPNAPVGLLTGSEDGFVLRHVLGGDGVPRDPVEVGAHVGGAAVRAVTLVAERVGMNDLGDNSSTAVTTSSTDTSQSSYLLLSAGAKEVLHAWRVAWVKSVCSNSDSSWHLRTSLVATRGTLIKQNHTEWKKGCGFVAASVESDQRFMDVTGIMSVNGCVALTASSSGAVTAMTLDSANISQRTKNGHRSDGAVQHSGAQQLRTFANLTYHNRPVLSVAVAEVKTKSGELAVISASGATDGTVACWDMSTAVQGLQDCNDATLSIFTLNPSHVTKKAHQSGVNGVSLCGSSPGFFVMASGGDDQVARCNLFSISSGDGASGFLISSVAVFNEAFSHSSAIKGVWLGGGAGREMHLATTSHDQRLRMWSVTTNEKNITCIPSAGAFVECPEPEGLDGFIGHDGNPRVAVCGRGVQTFRLE